MALRSVHTGQSTSNANHRRINLRRQINQFDVNIQSKLNSLLNSQFCVDVVMVISSVLAAQLLWPTDIAALL